MDDFPPPYLDRDWDDELLEHPAAREAVYRGHIRVQVWLEAYAKHRILSGDVIKQFHRYVFEGVFPEFAGHLRGLYPPDIPVDVQFGRHRGADRGDVAKRFQRLSENSEALIRRLDELKQSRSPEDFFSDVLQVAAYIHGEFVAIHPFVNGNGRTARLWLNYIMLRYNFLQIPFDRPKGEYLSATDAYIVSRDVGPFVEFLRPLCQPIQ